MKVGRQSQGFVLALRGGVLGPELCRMKVSRQSHGRKKQGLKLVSRQFRKQRLALWAAGRGPDPSFTAMVFWPCEGVLCPELCRMKVGRQSQGFVLALRGGVLGPELCRMKVSRQSHGRKKQGLKLVSRQFRKQRLALWAAGRGPDPSFTAMVFCPCEGVLGPELCRMKVSRQSHGRKKQGLKLVSRQFRKQRLAL